MLDLVDYSSDSDTDHQPVKKRKLAPFTDQDAPKDDPTKHQGRKRTVPFVQGQFCAYVYVPVFIPARSSLAHTLGDALHHAAGSVPTLRELGDLKNERELHISVTRPIYLRAHQRDDLKRAVGTAAKATPSFQASFATFDELQNDDASRTFLAAQVGAGFNEMKALTDALSPFIQALRQTPFYEQPRYHASIAWALLDGAQPGPTELLEDVSVPPTPDLPTSSSVARACPGPSDEADSRALDNGAPTSFQTIPKLPASLVPDLNAEYASRLAKCAKVDVDKICVRIGKQVSSWALSA